MYRCIYTCGDTYACLDDGDLHAEGAGQLQAGEAKVAGGLCR